MPQVPALTDMAIIKVDHLKRFYSVYKKEPGFIGSVKSFINRKYEDVKAVEDISFTIEKGELVGFIGPNGAGKTTTLKCLSGLLYPTSGKISVLGFEPYKREYDFLRKIGLIMGQKNQLWWDLPPTETFIVYKEIYGISDKEYKKVLKELVDLLGIQDILKIPVKRLSLGQRMKCELVASLIHKPQVLFLDEPTIGLDLVVQRNLRQFIKEYNRRYESTILLTSHYMGDVEELCKRIIIIDKGKILYDGLLNSLIKKYTFDKKLRILLRNKVKPEELAKFGEIINYSFPKAELSVKSEEVSKATGQILNKFQIEDLIIEEPEAEDIIREIFIKSNV